MKILVAEDELISRSILTGVLNKCGFEVESVGDGNHALEVLLSPNSPKLAILDWMMPGLDGVEVCRRIRSSYTNVPPGPPYIIILTSIEQKRCTVQALDAGANDYITKPYDTRELQARVGVGRRVVELQNQLVERVEELERATKHIIQLQGILPICMHCHKIRNDEQSWQQIENYIAQHSDVRFSHGVCPECRRLHYPDVPTSGK